MGGDQALLRNFINVCLGRDESQSDLSSGLTSTLMCLGARESVHRQAWVTIPDKSTGYGNPLLSTEPTPLDLEPLPTS